MAVDELLGEGKSFLSRYPTPHSGFPCHSTAWLLREGRMKQARYKGGAPGQLNPRFRRQSHGSESKSIAKPPADFRHLD